MRAWPPSAPAPAVRGPYWKSTFKLLRMLGMEDMAAGCANMAVQHAFVGKLAPQPAACCTHAMITPSPAYADKAFASSALAFPSCLSADSSSMDSAFEHRAPPQRSRRRRGGGGSEPAGAADAAAQHVQYRAARQPTGCAAHSCMPGQLDRRSAACFGVACERRPASSSLVCFAKCLLLTRAKNCLGPISCNRICITIKLLNCPIADTPQDIRLMNLQWVGPAASPATSSTHPHWCGTPASLLLPCVMTSCCYARSHASMLLLLACMPALHILH